MTRIGIHEFPDANGNTTYQVMLDECAPIMPQTNDKEKAISFAKHVFNKEKFGELYHWETKNGYTILETK